LRELVAKDIYLHRTMGVWSPFTRDIEAATAEWLDAPDPAPMACSCRTCGGERP